MSESEDMQFKFALPRLPKEAVRMTVAQAERVLLDQLAATKGDPTRAMWRLAQFYKSVGRVEKATEVLRQMLDRVPDLEMKAQVVLALGQTAEASKDHALAERFYREALSLEPMRTEVWYFIHNNLGYCLNQLGRFAEGERCCRNAIDIDPARANGHKNLGVSLEGQGRFEEAARAYVAATQANAGDGRAFESLKKLLETHAELAAGFARERKLCEVAVRYAAQQRARALEAWKKARAGEAGGKQPGTDGEPGAEGETDLPMGS